MSATIFLRYFLLAALCVPLAGYAAERRSNPESREYSDAAVAARIKAEIGQTDQANAANIHVRSVKGRVRLSGLVPTQDEADRAEDIAKRTKGVVTVQNDIKTGGTIIRHVGATPSSSPMFTARPADNTALPGASSQDELILQPATQLRSMP